MELRLATPELLKTAYERDLKPSFPPAELKPLREMLAELECGEYRPWCLLDGGELAGEAFVWASLPGFALFDYLCVAPARRNDGLGSLLIEKLAEAERGSVLFGESEIPAFAAERATAERRLAFYRRNGAKQAGYDTCIFGVPYHTLYWADTPVPDDKLRAAHEASYRSRFSEKTYGRYIMIPWEPSMGVPTQIPWLGENDENTGF